MMRPIVGILVLAAAFGGYRWWSEPRIGAAHGTDGLDGFIPVQMPDGAAMHEVLVLLPPDCPSEAAQRGAALVRHLASQGVPVRQGSAMTFDVPDPTLEQIAGIERAVSVFNQGPPTVMINGMAMSSPTPAQALAEFRRTQHGP